jgi:hypothetical protein
MAMIPIKQYRDFWDIPRIFLVEYGNSLFLFDCEFDEQKEDYGNVFHVYLMPKLTEQEFDGSWEKLSGKAERFLGEIYAADLTFDESRRESIDEEVLIKLLSGKVTYGR